MIHVVQEGETVNSIAAAYGISPTLLIYENSLSYPERLVVGQTLLVLIPAETHRVQEGDTLSSVFQTYGISQRRLYQLNPWLEGMPDIYPGQTLVLSYQDPIRGQLLVNGYSYPFIDISLLRSVLPYLSAVLPFTYGFSQDGSLVVIDDEEILLMAREQGTAALMVLAPLSPSGVFNNSLITRVLNDNTARENLINNIINTVESKNYLGVDMDFEYIRAADKDAYIAFCAELALRLHRIGRILSIALAPKYFAEQPGLLYEGLDYQALGEIADLCLLMTYEWGYTYGPPMAVSPIYEVRRVLEYGLSVIPAEKILMGISNYGYDWTLPYKEGTAARSISNVRAVELAWLYQAEILYDERAQSPYFNYTTPEGVEHIVWFEDLRSMQAKFDLRQELVIRGITYWTVTRPFPANFLLLASQYLIESL